MEFLKKRGVLPALVGGLWLFSVLWGHWRMGGFAPETQLYGLAILVLCPLALSLPLVWALCLVQLGKVKPYLLAVLYIGLFWLVSYVKTAGIDWALSLQMALFPQHAELRGALSNTLSRMLNQGLYLFVLTSGLVLCYRRSAARFVLLLSTAMLSISTVTTLMTNTDTGTFLGMLSKAQYVTWYVLTHQLVLYGAITLFALFLVRTLTNVSSLTPPVSASKTSSRLLWGAALLSLALWLGLYIWNNGQPATHIFAMPQNISLLLGQFLQYGTIALWIGLIWRLRLKKPWQIAGCYGLTCLIPIVLDSFSAAFGLLVRTTLGDNPFRFFVPFYSQAVNLAYGLPLLLFLLNLFFCQQLRPKTMLLYTGCGMLTFPIYAMIASVFPDTLPMTIGNIWGEWPGLCLTVLAYCLVSFIVIGLWGKQPSDDTVERSETV